MNKGPYQYGNCQDQKEDIKGQSGAPDQDRPDHAVQTRTANHQINNQLFTKKTGGTSAYLNRSTQKCGQH